MSGGEVVVETFDSRVLKGNALGDPTKRDVAVYLPRHLGEVLRRIRLDRPGNVAPRYMVRAGGSFRGRALRVLLRHGFPESPRGIPAARGPGEMAPLVLARAEPAPGGDVPGPEHDRHGGALLAESAEQ